MKLNDLKKIIKEEIAKVLAEQPETQEKEKVETDTDTKTKPKRRSITPEVPEEEPAKAMAKKIAARFKKGK